MKDKLNYHCFLLRRIPLLKKPFYPIHYFKIEICFSVTFIMNDFYEIHKRGKDGKSLIYMQCSKKQYNPMLKITESCRFQVRKDRFDPKAKHGHIFSDISSYFADSRGKTYEMGELDHELFVFIGKKNIPISTIISPEFFNLIQGVITLAKRGIGIEEIFPYKSRTTLTEKFIYHSEQLRNKVLDSCCGYCSLCIDAGTVGHNSNLDVVLYQPGVNPLLYEIVRGFKGDYSSYFQTIERIILELLSRNITIVALVTDNLCAQKKALNHNDPHSIMQYSQVKAIRNILWIPCQCHVLNLALKDFLSMEENSHVVPIIQKLIKLFHKKLIKRAIQSVAPSFIETRWKNIFNILKWCVSHLRRIIAITTTSNYLIQKEIADYKENLYQLVFSIIPEYYLLFHHYYMLINTIESDSCFAYQCPVIYNNFFVSIEKTINRNQSESLIALIHKFIDCIRERTEKTGDIQLLYFISSFSFQGRELVRNIFNFGNNFPDDRLDKKLNSEIFLINHENQQIINEYYDIILPEIQNIHQDIDLRHNLDIDEKLDNLEETNIDYSDDDSSSSFGDSIDYPNDFDNQNATKTETNNILDYGIEFLENYLRNSDDNIDVKQVVESYISWIIKPFHEIYPNLKYIKNNQDIWQILGFVPFYGELSKIGHKLLSIPSSEASAERFFSHQRRVIKSHSFRTNKRLERSRMIYRTEFDEI